MLRDNEIECIIKGIEDKFSPPGIQALKKNLKDDPYSLTEYFRDNWNKISAFIRGELDTTFPLSINKEDMGDVVKHLQKKFLD